MERFVVSLDGLAAAGGGLLGISARVAETGEEIAGIPGRLPEHAFGRVPASTSAAGAHYGCALQVRTAVDETARDLDRLSSAVAQAGAAYRRTDEKGAHALTR